MVGACLLYQAISKTHNNHISGHLFHVQTVAMKSEVNGRKDVSEENSNSDNTVVVEEDVNAPMMANNAKEKKRKPKKNKKKKKKGIVYSLPWIC